MSVGAEGAAPSPDDKVEQSDFKSDAPTDNVIKAKFSERDVLTVYLAADDLLSGCWSKACEFARNFGAPQVGIEHLLLGASHIRAAEPALGFACENLEELSHKLATRCARRSFAEVPRSNRTYEADKSLKAVLCEASALAAAVEAPSLTLTLVLQAIAKHEPRLAVLDLLPGLSPPEDPRKASDAQQLEALADLKVRLEELGSGLQGLSSSMLSPASLSTLGTEIGYKLDNINSTLNLSHRQIAQLHSLLVAIPTAVGTFGSEQPAVLRAATTDQLRSALAQLLDGVPTKTRELLVAEFERKSALQNATPPQPAVEKKRGWFSFLRS